MREPLFASVWKIPQSPLPKNNNGALNQDLLYYTLVGLVCQLGTHRIDDLSGLKYKWNEPVLKLNGQALKFEFD